MQKPENELRFRSWTGLGVNPTVQPLRAKSLMELVGARRLVASKRDQDLPLLRQWYQSIGSDLSIHFISGNRIHALVAPGAAHSYRPPPASACTHIAAGIALAWCTHHARTSWWARRSASAHRARGYTHPPPILRTLAGQQAAPHSSGSHGAC
ncbi:hypothetical protein F511_04224 [Dorcoceras hygrometricum]|uniref:Uncharacterized protein n=1 Tax=Dorcoceras hygrometricum TaxID=472368 RepID=A0A2Z7B6R5_9LAMI|nr:hypothetical protein F511_04224 [Dorcoceras hygrometricum]